MLELKKVYIPKTPKRAYLIKKILVKRDWEQIDVIYQSYGKGTEERKTTFTCKEKPSPDFIEALNQLLPNIHTICGLDAKNWASAYVSELRFKEVGGGTVVLITTKCEIDIHTITTTTPSMFPQNEFLDKLNGVIAEAEEYVAGKRAQLSLLEAS